MEDDQAYSQPGAQVDDDDRMYSRIVTGFAIGIAVLLALVFVSVLV